MFLLKNFFGGNLVFDFGLRIKELREARNMSQEALGRRVGRSKPVISSYENNLKTPPLDVLINLANVFNVSLDYLVGIKKREALYVNDLSDSQIEILKIIVNEFRENKSANRELSQHQLEILNKLIVEFLMPD